MLLFLVEGAWGAGSELQGEVVDALELAVKYYRTELSSRGGYINNYLADMPGWGDNQPPREINVEPPSTPEMGFTFLRAYEITGDQRYLEAAIAAADALVWGQLSPGGWYADINFLTESTWCYRHEGVYDPPCFQTCTFDDDKSQSVIRFLMRMGDLFGEPYAEAALYALEFVMNSQFPNGAWPQKYPLSGDYPNYYQDFYTFNDRAINDCIGLLILAYEKYGDKRYLKSAEMGGSFIIISQHDEPQAGWSQQYMWNMTPGWARPFEFPSVSSRVTSRNVKTLIDLYLLTGNETYLEPIPAAIDWLNNSMVGENYWEKFYELGTNLPLYPLADYVTTHNYSELDDDRKESYTPRRYGLIAIPVYNDLMSKGREQYLADLAREPSAEALYQQALGMEGRLLEIIDGMDDQGRWVEDGIIPLYDFNINVGLFLDYLEYTTWNATVPPLPKISSFSVTTSGLEDWDAMLLTANVTHSLGPGKISSVSLRFTPKFKGLDWLTMRDDGKCGDLVAGDGLFTYLLDPTSEMCPATYQGLIVVEDFDGHWNLATIPLGPIASVGYYLRELSIDVERAKSLGADTSQIDYVFPGLDITFGPVQNASSLKNMREQLMGIAERLEIEDVKLLIDLTEMVLNRAREMGIDTSRQEIFLTRAREEHEIGNYGPAKQFTAYPLKLSEELGEGNTLQLTFILLIVLISPCIMVNRRTCFSPNKACR
jgi:hypothetical protein